MNKPAVLIVLILVTMSGTLLILSCGGGSSGSDVTPPAESLTGTYTLQYVYRAGYDCGYGLFGFIPELVEPACGPFTDCSPDMACDWTTPILEIYSEDYPGMTGTLTVLQSSIHEAISWSGEPLMPAWADSYSAVYSSNPAEGYIDFEEEIDTGFICEGNLLTLLSYFEGYVGFPVNMTLASFQHYEWVKVSDEAVWPE